MADYLRYRDDLATIEADEPETFRKIADLMLAGRHEGRAPVVANCHSWPSRVASPGA